MTEEQRNSAASAIESVRYPSEADSSVESFQATAKDMLHSLPILMDTTSVDHVHAVDADRELLKSLLTVRYDKAEISNIVSAPTVLPTTAVCEAVVLETPSPVQVIPTSHTVVPAPPTVTPALAPVLDTKVTLRAKHDDSRENVNDPPTKRLQTTQSRLKRPLQRADNVHR